MTLVGTKETHLPGPTHWWTACNLSAQSRWIVAEGDAPTCLHCLRGEPWPPCC